LPIILKFDDLVKSLKRQISVIPAKAGIQLFQILKNSLDSGLHRSDDFLREHQICHLNFAFCIQAQPVFQMNFKKRGIYR